MTENKNDVCLSNEFQNVRTCITYTSCMICMICMEEVSIPVEFLCFPCHQVGHDMNHLNSPLSFPCSAYSRVCMMCAETYLELDRPIYSRTEKKRCLLCPTECPLQNLRRQHAYRIDFLWIQEHDQFQIQRPQEGWECPWCFENGNSYSRWDLWRHVQTKCPNFGIECECREIIRRGDWEHHKSICASFTLCEECVEWFPKRGMATHMSDKHQKSQCSICLQYIPFVDILHHILRSCSIPEQCPICDISVLRCNLHHHIRFQHLDYDHILLHQNEHDDNVNDDNNDDNDENEQLIIRPLSPFLFHSFTFDEEEGKQDGYNNNDNNRGLG